VREGRRVDEEVAVLKAEYQIRRVLKIQSAHGRRRRRAERSLHRELAQITELYQAPRAPREISVNPVNEGRKMKFIGLVVEVMVLL
jgi:hypothetical protein